MINSEETCIENILWNEGKNPTKKEFKALFLDGLKASHFSFYRFWRPLKEWDDYKKNNLDI